MCVVSLSDVRCSAICPNDFRLRDLKRHGDPPGSGGNYQAYIDDLERRKGPDADQPHRIAYRKLVRA